MLKCEEIIVYQQFKLNILISLIHWNGVYFHFTNLLHILGIKKWVNAMLTEKYVGIPRMPAYTLHYTCIDLGRESKGQINSLPEPTKAMYLAYHVLLCCFEVAVVLLMWTVTTTGPRIDPCGTPFVISRKSYLTASADTHWVVSVNELHAAWSMTTPLN